MATITFKAKVESVFKMDDSLAYQYVVVPKFTRSHCDMNAFRSHPKYGSYANSDLFLGILSRIRSDLVKGGLGIRLDSIPENVIIDTSGFLATVTITI